MMLFKKNYREISDEELMSLFTRNDKAAFDELYRRYSKALLNFFYRMLRCDREKAEDFLHDLFLKIIESPDKYDESKRFNTWFYTLAGNMIKNEYRNHQVRQEREKRLAEEQYHSFDVNNEAVDKDRFSKQLEAELDKLNTELKTIFNLRFREEMSVKKISEIIKCPEGTVKSRLFYLSKQLSKKLSYFTKLF